MKKIEPYLIAEEIADYMRKYGQTKHELASRAFAASRTLAEARKSGADQEQVAEAVKAFERAWAAQTEAENAAKAIGQRAEQRYILSFKRENGEADIDAIIADAKEIIDAIEKADYDEWLRFMKQGLQELIKEKPGKDAPEMARYNYNAAVAMQKRGFKTFVDFLSPHVRVQRNALVYYKAQDRLLEIQAYIEAKALQYYRIIPKGYVLAADRSPDEQGEQPQQSSEIVERAKAEAAEKLANRQQDFFNIPTSPAVDLLMTVAGAGEHLPELEQRMKGVSHSYGYSYSRKNLGGNDFQETLTKSRNGESELAVITTVYGGKYVTAQKLLCFILQKINEQAYFNGQLTRDFIVFPLAELVQNGMYSTIRSARKGFTDGIRALKAMQVEGKIGSQKGKTDIDYEAGAVLFVAHEIDKGQCKVFLYSRLNWAGIMQYYTISPSYAYGLSNRSFKLLWYIFYLARQNMDKLEKPGYFNISYRAIQHRLSLPNETTAKNPSRDIKDEIDRAIEEIETSHSKTYHNTELALLPVVDDTLPIKDYLDTGYLQVSLKGQYAATFLGLNEKRTKRIEQARKKKDRIVTEARIRNTQKALKEKAADHKQ